MTAPAPRRATARTPLQHVREIIPRVLDRLCGCGCDAAAAPDDTHAPECRREMDDTYDREVVT